MKIMGFTVEELLHTKEAEHMTLICGREGIKNEIKGVTIIEAPDIVKFINGGELLLTGLYAFKSCSAEEFKNYIFELQNKKISAMIFKRGRIIEQVETKIALLKEYTEDNKIPLIEVPFELSFQKVMAYIMERLFNEEVTRLKYFKTTHDNFTVLSLTKGYEKNPIGDILGMLEKLIRNPVALYNQNMSCYANTTGEMTELKLSENLQDYDPGILTNYLYMKQEQNGLQYMVRIHLHVGIWMYLVVTERDSVFTLMDCIALENAIVALQYEFSRKFAVSELEKKFQNDILNGILSGKVISEKELNKSASLLGMDMEGYYRVIVFGVTNVSGKQKNINEKFLHINCLEETVRLQFRDVKVHKDMDKVVVIQPADLGMSQAEARKKIKEMRDKLQSALKHQNKNLRVRAGVGKIVEGVIHLPESYKEADDAYSFIDIAGDISEDGDPYFMMFSDFGIFKLLCQLDDPVMLMEYIPESLQKLYQFKKPQQEDLIITLKAYLKYNQNLSKTAQNLYVHYKTAAYRIDKIAKITGIDFDNSNEILAVRIGLVVHKLLESYNKS